MKIKPCPFCGGRASFRFTIGEAILSCLLCHANIHTYRLNGTSEYRERKHLKERWNLRTPVEVKGEK